MEVQTVKDVGEMTGGGALVIRDVRLTNQLGIRVGVDEIANANVSVTVVIPYTEHVLNNLQLRKGTGKDLLVFNRDIGEDFCELGESPRVHSSHEGVGWKSPILSGFDLDCAAIELIESAMS